MGFNDKFYKKKAVALGVNIDKDSVIYGSNINELKTNVKAATGTTTYDFSKYPIKNSMFQLENKSGEKILSQDYWTTIPRFEIKK